MPASHHWGFGFAFHSLLGESGVHGSLGFSGLTAYGLGGFSIEGFFKWFK